MDGTKRLLPEIFDFEATDKIRACCNANGEPVLIAADICKVFGVDNVSQSLSRLDDDEKGLCLTETPGGKQKLAYVTESGFYALVLSFRVRKSHMNYEKAQRFRKWVTSEVLPAIRKTGRYESPLVISARDPRLVQAELISELVRGQIEAERRLAAVEAGQSQAAQYTREIEDDLDRTRRQLERVTAETAHLMHAVTGASGFRTLTPWARERGVHLTHHRSQAEGNICKGICIKLGIEPGRHRRGDYRFVNTYPTHVLELWLDDYRRREDGKTPTLFRA